jgi:uncharacterized protein YndB with AHSA1/START domain/DNA-binding transcriptional ArsR family regulator
MPERAASTDTGPRNARSTKNVDEAFRALADPTRRELLDRLNERNGQTLRELCHALSMTRQSVSKHLAVLQSANLVATVRRGREKLHYLNAVPIVEIAERWINRYDHARAIALSDLRDALEVAAMDRPEFVYTIYIDASPQRVWTALTDPAFTRRYWNLEFETDWQHGAAMAWLLQDGPRINDLDQVVLESDPPKRLAYTWHSFTSEWAAAYGVKEETRARFAAERRSRVTFELEAVGEMTKLTVVHDGFDSGSEVLAGVIDGWPMILSKLKSVIEQP